MNSMPRYTYKCDSCAAIYDVTHSMNDRMTVCDDCGEESLVRMPPNFTSTSNRPSPTHQDQKPGTVVKNFIEQANEEINEGKKNMTKELEL